MILTSAQSTLQAQAIILSDLLGRRRKSPVSARALIARIRIECPDNGQCDDDLKVSIFRTAQLLDLIPFYWSDPIQAPRSGDANAAQHSEGVSDGEHIHRHG